MITLEKEGLYFAPGNFFLDPKYPVETAVVSHAHGDHFVNGHKNVYCTIHTDLLIQQRITNYYGKKITVAFHDAFQINGCKVYFIPAGHILGSAQVIIEHNDIRYIYTGDFKLAADKTCEPFEFITADVLITESTFAEEGLRHPIAESEIEKLNDLGDINIILGVYSLGKAQRVIQLINERCPSKKIMVHRSIGLFNKVYEKSGYPLGEWAPYDKHAFRKQKNIVYLLPPARSRSFYPQPNYLRAFATGWDHLQQNLDFKLFISDHADWYELLTMIERTNAKKIFTLHGNGDDLKEHLEPTGISVTILN